MLVFDALVLLEMLGDLLAVLVLGQPEPLDVVAVVELAEPGDVVVVRVRNDEVGEPLAPVAIVGQNVVEQLEDVDPVPGQR